MFRVRVDIPNDASWPVKPISDLCTLISRGTAPVYVEQSDVFAIGQRCVTSAGFDASKVRPHSPTAMSRVLRPAFGDVLLNSTGTGTLGRSCVFESQGAFMVDGHVTVLRPSISVLDAGWLNAFLRSTWGQRHLERYCYSGSTNQLELNRRPLLGSAIPTPPIEEQSMFSSIISSIEATIQQTEAIIEKLKLVKQGLLHDLLTRGIDVNGELRPPQSQAPHIYKDSPLGWIPKEWDVVGLADIAPESRVVLRTGPFGSSLKGEHFTESGRPVVTIGSLGVGKFIESALLFVSEATAHELKDFELVPGDIAFSRVADVGRSVVVEVAQRGWIMSSNFMRIAVDTGKVEPHFLQAALAFDARLKRQMRSTINSAGRDVASSAIMMSLRFALPAKDEQSQILTRIEVFDARLEGEEDGLQKLVTLRAGLMGDLLTGRVRVTPLLDTVEA